MYGCTPNERVIWHHQKVKIKSVPCVARFQWVNLGIYSFAVGKHSADVLQASVVTARFRIASVVTGIVIRYLLLSSVSVLYLSVSPCREKT